MPSASASPASGRPERRTLAWLVGSVLVVHVSLLLGMSGALDFQLQTHTPASVSPLQTRMITPPIPQAGQVVKAPASSAAPRTRIAQQAAPQAVTEPTPEPTPASHAEVAPAPTPPAEPTLPPEAPPVLPAPTEAAPASPAEPVASAKPTEAAPALPIPAGDALPNIPLGALPPSSLLSYSLTGQEKGLSYHASGELSWQHNDQAYALSLSVKAFLVGSRQWRSVGDITATGLAPRRFSDSWRSERASHFDRDKQRIVFSSNAPEAPLLAGAQDQISLYVQLASAMAGSPERFAPGTRLQIQTVTLRDALPWMLTLEQNETLTVDDQALSTAKWVCQPRSRYDAKVEFWVAEKHHWLPVRIRITQASGNFIDLNLRRHQPLPTLPAAEKTTPP